MLPTLLILLFAPSFRALSHTAPPLITPPPPPPTPHHDLHKREIGSQTCGWVNGNFNSPFTCNQPAATCLWNSALHLVGCGNTDLAPFVTKCIPYSSASLVSGDTTDLSVQICSASAPYCYTPSFPDEYSILPCGISEGMRMSVALTYAGQAGPVPLPRFLGVDGKVTAGTQYPGGVTPSPSSSNSAPASSSSSLSASTMASTGNGGSQKNNTGAIVGGTIGGVAVTAGICFTTVVVLRGTRRRKRNEVVGGANEVEQRREFRSELGADERAGRQRGGVYEMEGNRG
ncbi:hypothetical protein BKA61DRAFT_602257 [Leptodontidium sp. MPI-SDFR-AT-0119]|nr:hypothetical protein BKA61DRAFT_602257 [Leptodontidium sp. MPI-SDFR-AT-0119]